MILRPDIDSDPDWRDYTPITDDDVPGMTAEEQLEARGYVRVLDIAENIEDTPGYLENQYSIKPPLAGEDVNKSPSFSKNIDQKKQPELEYYSMGMAMSEFRFSHEDYERETDDSRWNNILEALIHGLKMTKEKAELLLKNLDKQVNENDAKSIATKEQQKVSHYDILDLFSGLKPGDSAARAKNILKILDEVKTNAEWRTEKTAMLLLSIYGIEYDDERGITPEESDGIVTFANKLVDNYMSKGKEANKQVLIEYLDKIIADADKDDDKNWRDPKGRT